MQRLVGLLGRVRERAPSSSASAPCAAGDPELREEGRGGLHSMAARGDLAQLRRCWWWKRLRINWRNAERQTPLHLACVNGHADVVRFLARKKCQLNSRDNFKKSPLMKAVEHQHEDCVAILLEHGASPNLRDGSGNTALHMAAMLPRKPLAALLLEHNAHIDAQNKLGYTPLTTAITRCHEEMVEFLLQKGADVHAQDNHKRTPLMIAALVGDLNVIQLLLRHGADISHRDQFNYTAMFYARMHPEYPSICTHLNENKASETREECSVRGAEDIAGLNSSSSGKTPHMPLGAPQLPEAGVLPVAGVEVEKDDVSPLDSETVSEGPGKASAGVQLPAANRPGVCALSIPGERGNGVLPVTGEEDETDDVNSFDVETVSEGPGKASAGVQLPAANRPGVCALSIPGERGNGVLPVTGEEDETDDVNSFDVETVSEGPGKASAGVQLPAANRPGVCALSIPGECGNGVLPVTGEEDETDDVNSFDVEKVSEGPGKASAVVQLPAANRPGVCALSIPGERGNGVLPVAGAELVIEDVNSFDVETVSEGPGKASAGVQLPAANRPRVCALSIPGERGNGVLPVTGEEDETDDVNSFDVEKVSEGPGKASAGVQLPAANRPGVCALSIPGERGNGVLPVTGAELVIEDVNSFDVEKVSEGPGKASAGVQLPAANRPGVCALSIPGERGNGVLPVTGEEDETDDVNSFDVETVSEGPGKASAGVQLPAANRPGVCALSIPGERGNGVLPVTGEEDETDDVNSFDVETVSEGPGKASAGVQLPAANRPRVCALSIPGERGNGVLPVTGEEDETDDVNSFDVETVSEGPGKASAGVQLPAANRPGVCALSIPGERGNGVLPVTGAELVIEDVNSFDVETVSEGPGKASAGVQLPAANRPGVCALSIPGERGNGVLPVTGEEDETDDVNSFDVETVSEGPGKASAGVQLPAANRPGVCALSIPGERGNGVLPVTGEEDETDDVNSFDVETVSEGPGKASAGVQLPAANRPGVCALSIPGERGNGVLPVTGEEDETDDVNSFDVETVSEGPGKASAGVQLPAANRPGVCALSIPGERGNGVLPVTGEEDETDDVNSFDVETVSEGPGKASAGVQLPAANRPGVCALSIPGERGNGVLPVTGEEDETDDVNSFDVETVSEGPGKASAGVQLPAANRPRVCAWSIPGERGNGVLPVAGAELVIEDVNSFDVETVSEGLGKALAGTQLPAANRPRVCAWSIPGERGNGVLPVTGEEDETDDVNSFDVETVSEGPGKALAGVQLPAANRPGVCALSIPGERGNGVLPAAGAEQELDDDSFTENEGLSSLEVSAGDREEFQLKKDASTQGDDQVYSQRWVKQLQQELANALKKNSLAEASLEAKKHYSRHLQEQKLQLQKELDRSKAKLQELTERHMRTECYAESLKNAIKNKERELTTSRNLQGLLAASSGTAAIPELEERIQWLQAGKVRLEATAQQQAKTIKALQKHLQASASAHNGLKDLTIGFQTTRAPMDYQHRQRGSESKEVKKVAEMKCRTEALLREMQGRNSALEEECTRLKMLLEGSRAKLMAYVGRASHLRFRAEMRKSSSEVAKQVYKLRRKSQLNLQHGQ